MHLTSIEVDDIKKKLKLVQETTYDFLNDSENIFLLFDLKRNHLGMHYALECCEIILGLVLKINEVFDGLHQTDEETLIRRCGCDFDLSLLWNAYNYMKTFNQLITNIHEDGIYCRAFFYIEHILFATVEFEKSLIL